MKSREILLWVGVFLIGITIPAVCQEPEGKARSTGDDLLKKMSQKLGSAKAFSFKTSETLLIESGDKKAPHSFTTTVLIRRPNGIHYVFYGEKDWNFWYDGKFMTAVSDQDKAFIQASMPATIDETLDEIADRFDFNMPMSDMIYSSPYDAFISSKTTGGLVGDENIGGLLCHHLSYHDEAADWQIWISDQDSLPCRLEITYKQEEGKPVSRITFSDWNLSPAVSDRDFAFAIPKECERIPILERIRLEESSQAQSRISKR